MALIKRTTIFSPYFARLFLAYGVGSMNRVRLTVAATTLVALAGLAQATSQERVLICHLKDHAHQGYTDHLGPCTPEELLAGGRNVTVLTRSLKARHGIDPPS